MSDEELVTAYLDGSAELTPEERRRAEAVIDANPVDAEETKGLLAELRALPPPEDPDYKLLEAAIGSELPRLPRVRWGAVSGVLAAAATIALFVGVQHGRAPMAAPDQPAPAPLPAPTPTDDGRLYFTDGDDLGDLDLDDLSDDVLDAALDRDDDLGDVDDYVSLGAGSQLGPTLDQLDEGALERLDSWLATKKGT